MTAGILDPSANTSDSQLTSTEEELAARIDAEGKKARNPAEVAVVLGAAFILYHQYMKRRLREAMKDQDPSNLAIVASMVYGSMVPRWVQMVGPALISGYLQGTRDVRGGDIPTEYLMDIAQSYATQLGQHLNEVSIEAAIQGYNAQVNRRVVARRAVENVIGAFGVPLRTMNSLVTIWTGTPNKVLSRTKPTTPYDAKAEALINKAIHNRGKTMGETEAWTAKSQAKQLAWMWGVQHGTIPETATRVWRTARDERVCPVCGPLDKVEVPVGEAFKTDAGDYWSPPLHPNCRCDIDLAVDIIGAIQTIKEDQPEEKRVGKALGDDPYDRDSHGRFARQEQRKPKPKLRPVTTTFKEPLAPIVIPDRVIEVPEKAEEAQKEETTTRESLGGRERLGGRGSLRRASIGQRASLSDEAQTKEIAPTRRSLRSSIRKPLRSSLRGEERLLRELGVDEPESINERWVPLERPLYGIAETRGDDIRGRKGSDAASDDEKLFEVDMATDFYTARDIPVGIRNHFEQWKEDMLARHRDQDNMPEGMYKHKIDGREFLIDDTALEQILDWKINAEPAGKAVLLYSIEGERDPWDVEDSDYYGQWEVGSAHWFRAQELWDNLAFGYLQDEWEENEPIIIMTTYGPPGMADRKYSAKNPGFWKPHSSVRMPQEGWGYFESELPYTVVAVEPVDLYGDDDYRVGVD